MNRPRIYVANRADGGICYWLVRLYSFGAAVLSATAVAIGLAGYSYFSRLVPEVPDFSRYTSSAPTISRILSADGSLLGEFATEWRELVAFDSIPDRVVNGFLAAEDHRFFDHRGLDFRGIARAVRRNVLSGGFAQGGSTITQQVAKQFLGTEKSLTRKLKEAILARRLEATYSKRAILSFYLNHIYLGGGAYGVKAAAKRYFSKPLADLSLAEAATLAGLAKAPSRYTPLSAPKRARVRRDAVLKRMVRYGFASHGAANLAAADPVHLRPTGVHFGDVSPYFAEHIRRTITNRYGSDALLRGGLTIDTTIEPAIDRAAYENVDHGVRVQDRRQGWRGAIAHLEGAEKNEFIARAETHYGHKPLTIGRRYLGLVTRVATHSATVRVGSNFYRMALRDMAWAAPWRVDDATNDREVAFATDVVRRGDVIWVEPTNRHREAFREWMIEGLNPRWLPAADPALSPRREIRLAQTPHPQGALLTVDHRSGYVIAMVGGSDYGRSQYNRTTQACRQPASTYKPIYYSLALDQGYGYDTLLNDIPRLEAEVDPKTGEQWVPMNLHGVVQNLVTLEYALVFSKNVPAVTLFRLLGADSVKTWARRLGFTSQIIADKALALGASCTTLDELTRAFGIFARNGRWLDLVSIRRVRDRNGRTLEDNTAFYDSGLSPTDRVHRFVTTAGTSAIQSIPARTAHLTNVLLARAIRHGFASIIRRTGIQAAGKTGTSSATMDTTFIGYTSRWITTVWLGDDRRIRPLGVHDAAYMTVVPMWARYMVEVANGHKNHKIPWSNAAGVLPTDRGGTRGPQAVAPMALQWVKRHRPENPPSITPNHSHLPRNAAPFRATD